VKVDRTRLLVDAVAFAAYKHRRQRRKDAEASPYINHPIALARVLSVEGGISDTTLLAAAVLHDTLEDTETTFEELKERFGAAVAAVVLEVTDDKSLPKKERKRLQIQHASRIKRICEAAGGGLGDLVKMTIFMVDITKNTEVWRARREFFSGDFPASTLVEVRSLAGAETLVEIEAVAYLGGK
jgi:guanosine-3',5'-bis(diphosphate) 3'-pyrophosphohydrolase